MFLNFEDIKDDIVIIKINKLYSPEMSPLELYEATRGIWKRKIESVADARYALAVANKQVVEVYKIKSWMPAGTTPMKTRVVNPDRCEDRIEFVGSVASDSVREEYVGKYVDNLFKFGEASPVKFIKAYNM